MDSVGAAIAMLVVASAVVGAGAVAQLALEDGGEYTAVTETVTTGNVSELVVLNESNREDTFYSDTVNITNATGVTMQAGEDYTWHDRNGTFTVKSSQLANQDATVEYEYRTATANQLQISGWIATLIETGYALPLLFMVLLIVLGASALGGLT